eukprot:gene7316-biopygen7954
MDVAVASLQRTQSVLLTGAFPKDIDRSSRHERAAAGACDRVAAVRHGPRRRQRMGGRRPADLRRRRRRRRHEWDVMGDPYPAPQPRWRDLRDGALSNTSNTYHSATSQLQAQLRLQM